MTTKRERLKYLAVWQFFTLMFLIPSDGFAWRSQKVNKSVAELELMDDKELLGACRKNTGEQS